MMKKQALVLFLFISQLAISQLKTVSFEAIDSLQLVQKKPIVVFIYTDWCQFCKQMQQTTFKDASVISDLNDHFYFIAFNGESQEKITFNHQNFEFKPSGINAGVNTLAVALGTIDKQLTYPVLCVLNDKNEILFQYSGFLNVKELRSVLRRLSE